MSRYVFLRPHGALLSFALFAFAGCGGAISPMANASLGGSGAVAAPADSGWIDAGGIRLHRPHYALSRSASSNVTPLFFFVPYLGGAVIVKPIFYFTFWGYKKIGDPD